MAYGNKNIVNVHIVCRDLHEDKILPRLAKTLAVGAGWTLSDQPDKHADLNYFIIYIDYAERFSDWHQTPIAAYFSHYDPSQSFRKFWWETAAQAMDICVITDENAAQWLPHKRIVKVTPPIDPIFKSLERKANDRPRIGFSGYIDRLAQRKGANLAARLVNDLGDRYDFVACGAGWPVETKLYPFDQLPAFYNSLDLLVCTATLEGIPMPPLEALACGVPVVIPQGVGLLDELPNVIGIWRYAAGDYTGLKNCVGAAMALQEDDGTKIDPVADTVKHFTPAQWCADHVAAFSMTQGKPAYISAVKESDRHGKRGVLYVAYGGPARACAENAMHSFRQHMPDVPIALVSTESLGIEDVFIQHADEDIGGRSAKTLIDTLAPREWQYVLYLDADTEVIAPLDFLFQAVEDGFDFVICKNPGKYHTARQMIRSDNKDECDSTFNAIGSDELIQLNGGVFCYARNSRTAAFFETWHKEWLRWGKRDQAALLRALFACPLKINVLGSEWNTILRYDARERAAAILHYPMTARRWRGVLHDRSDSPDAWRAVKDFEATR
jgi:hypothetical protein